ncbi:MAG: response regulator [Moraxellaceae bacterium]|nr:response regulator [Moraxellaceae bacterium]
MLSDVCDLPTIFLIENDAHVRQSIRILMSPHGLPVETFANAEEFLRRWQPEWMGILVLDVRLPGMSGLDLQELLLAQGAKLPMLFITRHGDVSACRQALRNGALDFLTTPVDEQALINGIWRGIVQNIEFRRQAGEPGDTRQRIEALSEREKKVLELMLNGLPNKLIARELNLSTRTIESHRARVFSKLQTDSLAALVRLVVKAEHA